MMANTISALGAGFLEELARGTQAASRFSGQPPQAVQDWEREIMALRQLASGHPVAEQIGRSIPYMMLPIRVPAPVTGAAVGALADVIGSGGDVTPEDVFASAMMGAAGGTAAKVVGKAFAPNARMAGKNVVELWKRARQLGFKIPPGETLPRLRAMDRGLLHHPLVIAKAVADVWERNSKRFSEILGKWLNPQEESPRLTRDFIAKNRAAAIQELQTLKAQSKPVTLPDRLVKELRDMGIPAQKEMTGAEALSVMRDLSAASVDAGPKTPRLWKLYNILEEKAFPSKNMSKAFQEAKVKFRVINALDSLNQKGRGVNPTTGEITDAKPIAAQIQTILTSKSARRHIPKDVKDATRVMEAFSQYMTDRPEFYGSISSALQTSGTGAAIGGGLGYLTTGDPTGGAIGGLIGATLPFVAPAFVYKPYMSEKVIDYLTRNAPPGLLDSIARGAAVAVVPRNR